MKKLIKMEDIDPTIMTAFRQMIREEIKAEIMPFRFEMNQRLDIHDRKIDALTSDVMRLQEVTGAIWDKMALEDSRNKREIDEIKGHLGLKPLDPL